MQTLEQFISKAGLEFDCKPTNANPHMSDMPHGSSHWLCTIRNADGNGEMVVPFSQGPGLEKMPTLADVLDCLASDAAGFQNAASFEDWASEYGYDTDSRKAEKIYKAVSQQSSDLELILGSGLYEELLFETERQ
jgi:hypothetical protein